MAQLKTRYMGCELQNPIIAGASSLTSNINSIRKIEEAGAGAIVTASLFEEQIQLERFKMEEELHRNDHLHAEMITIFPDLKHSGPEEHLMWVRKAKESIGIPVFGSLNAVSRETWVEYSKSLAETGVDGIELNFYASPRDFSDGGVDIETEQLEIIREIRKNLTIPIGVKLSPFYSNPLSFIRQLDQIGVDGFVLFNRFFQPDIDVEGERNIYPFNYSSEGDYRLPLRFAGLLYGNVKAGICGSTGLMSGADVIKMILAGADCVQLVSVLYKKKVSVISSLLKEIEQWMDSKGYTSLQEVRGKLSRGKSKDPSAYTRAQYARLLLHPEKLFAGR